MFLMTAPGSVLWGRRGALGVCGGKWGSGRTRFNSSPPQRQAPPPHAPIFAIASGPGFHGERHGVIQWPVHHLQLRHDQPHPPYLASRPPLVATDRPTSPPSSSKKSANVFKRAAVVTAPVNVFLATNSSAAVTRFVAGLLGGELAGNCGSPRV